MTQGATNVTLTTSSGDRPITLRVHAPNVEAMIPELCGWQGDFPLSIKLKIRTITLTDQSQTQNQLSHSLMTAAKEAKTRHELDSLNYIINPPQWVWDTAKALHSGRTRVPDK